MKKRSASSPPGTPRHASERAIRATPKLRMELRQPNRPDSAIDLTDAPEVTSWDGAVRGRFYRPIKEPISLRVDTDILAWFRSTSTKYQSQINKALREYMEQHKRQPAATKRAGMTRRG